MFLSKKTAAGFNKPKTQETIKPKRVLGGTKTYIQAGMMTINKKNKLHQQSKHLLPPIRP